MTIFEFYTHERHRGCNRVEESKIKRVITSATDDLLCIDNFLLVDVLLLIYVFLSIESSSRPMSSSIFSIAKSEIRKSSKITY